MKNILKKASKQVLCEVIGFDESKLYYLLLTKNNKKIKKEFSYSKKYRILKSLFKKGVVGKIRNNSEDFFTYIVLPPSFLHFSNKNKEIIRYLEEIYVKNYLSDLNTNFSQMILKDEKGLILFFLKYLMKDKANIFGTEINPSLLGKDKKRVSINLKSKKDKSRGTIDERFKFEFSVIKNKDSNDYIGYISNELS